MKMARLPLNNFRASEQEKMGSFNPVPAGVYNAQITKSEVKETRGGDGKYLNLTFTVLEGDYVNRNVWARLNIVNANAQTVEIANKALATICECCGIDALEDTEQLHNTPMEINVIVKEATAQYPAQNDVRGYTPIVGSGSVPGSAPPSGGSDATKAPPWTK
tara:strand:- start:10103 stop:10588 length:486 start_codon:yes stop_codon:yes gene_type:complete